MGDRVNQREVRNVFYFASVDGELDSIGDLVQILFVLLVLDETVAQLGSQLLVLLR